MELHLWRAVSHFGAKRDLRSIGVAQMRAWVVALPETERNPRSHNGRWHRPPSLERPLKSLPQSRGRGRRRPRLQPGGSSHGEALRTVGEELGHGGESLVKRVYGNLGQVRHHSEVVEYRVEQHRAKLEECLSRLDRGALGTAVDTASAEQIVSH